MSSNSGKSLDVLKFIVCCVAAGCVTRPSVVWKSPTGCVCIIAWDVEASKGGGLDSNWSVAPQKKNSLALGRNVEERGRAVIYR